MKITKQRKLRYMAQDGIICFYFYRFTVHSVGHLITHTHQHTHTSVYYFSGATALQGLGRQSGRRRAAKLVPTFADRGVSRGQRNGYII